jgi:hypothetical protein
MRACRATRRAVLAEQKKGLDYIGLVHIIATTAYASIQNTYLQCGQFAHSTTTHYTNSQQEKEDRRWHNVQHCQLGLLNGRVVFEQNDDTPCLNLQHFFFEKS